MKKIVCAILASAALVTALAGCSKEAKEGYEIVKDATCEFSFQYPGDWTPIYDSGILVIEKVSDEGRARIVGHSYSRSQDEVESKNASEYWEKNYFPMLTETYGEANIVQTATEPVMYSHSGKEYEQICVSYTKTLGDDVYSCKTILILAQDRVCTLTLTHRNGDTNASYYSDVLMNCLETFEIKMFSF